MEPGSACSSPPVVLVADDDVPVLDLVTTLMQDEGYQVLAAADGHEALALSRGYPGRIDLAITDLEMPGLNGIHLCSQGGLRGVTTPKGEVCTGIVMRRTLASPLDHSQEHDDTSNRAFDGTPRKESERCPKKIRLAPPRRCGPPGTRGEGKRSRPG